MIYRDRSIKRKLMGMVGLTGGVVLAVSCGTLFVYEIVTVRKALVAEVSTIGRVVAANTTAALAFDNRTDATDVLSALAADRHIVAAALYDSRGALFARFPAALPDTRVPRSLPRDGYEFTRSRLVLQSPVASDARPLGTLVIESDLTAMYASLWQYGGLAALAIVLASLIGLPLSRRLQRHVSEPILALADTARAVAGRRDYAARAAKFGNDEIGALADAFNEMLTRIEAQDAEIRAMNASLEERVQERTAALAEANREMEAFSYSVSHDLRAPLRHVHGYVELLRRTADGQLSVKAQRYLETISDASIEMGQLIDDLLAFSRTARAEMREANVRLDQVVSETIRGLEMATTGRTIEWQTAPLPAVVGDPPLVKQVLANLIDNAVKYTRHRDPARIEIGCAGEEDGRVVLFVRDNGAGFDMQYAHKLFGVFQRLHRAEEFEGTGIGLATVRRIISRHGGRAWAEGAVGEGATFYFTLKRSEAA